jgi:hypothetical protein
MHNDLAAAELTPFNRARKAFRIGVQGSSLKSA